MHTNTHSNKAKPIVWTISGHDPSGGAGITADVKTLHSFGVEACAIITANTVQNSDELLAINATNPKVLEQQFQALIDDKTPEAIKIGMLASDEQIYWLIEKINLLKANNAALTVVYDPVAAATVGGVTTEVTKDAILQLFQAIDVITPNMPEAEKLTGIYLAAVDDIAAKFASFGIKNTIIKGGHNDVFDDDNSYCIDYGYQFDAHQKLANKYAVKSEKIHTDYSHGGGCCFASSIAALLSQGYLLRDALTITKAFITQGLTANQGRIQYYGAFEVTTLPSSPENFPEIFSTELTRYDALANFASLELGDEQLGLYPVVDSLTWLERLLPLGLNIIQLRVKNLEGAELEQTIAKAVALAKNTKTRLFINDYWQLAIKYQAYGVHLGQEDLAIADLTAIQKAGLRLGISTHGCYEFLLAKHLCPSYLAIGAIFPTKTKDMTGQIQGLDNLKQLVTLNLSDIPVVAIGGINQSNIAQVHATGVDSIAVVTAITESDNPEQAVSELTALCKTHKQ